jgi:hypothetical protein
MASLPAAGAAGCGFILWTTGVACGGGFGGGGHGVGGCVGSGCVGGGGFGGGGGVGGGSGVGDGSGVGGGSAGALAGQIFSIRVEWQRCALEGELHCKEISI